MDERINETVRTSDIREFEQQLHQLKSVFAQEFGHHSVEDTRPRIGKYVIQQVLSERGQAFVFIALDEDLLRSVVIKLYRPGINGERKRKVLSEGRALAKLDHPGIVKCYGVEEFCGCPFLVLEFIAGSTLSTYCSENTISEKESLNAICALADATSYANENGLLHLDLKPANVMVTPAREYKLIDFGLTPSDGPADTNSSNSGTPAFMSPERAAGKPVDKRTDVFGLGGILYFLLSGTAPFAGETKTQSRELSLAGHVKSLSDQGASVSGFTNRLCMKCLDADPDQRFKTAGEIRDEVNTFKRRGTFFRFAACALSVLLLGFLAVQFIPDSEQNRSLPDQRVNEFALNVSLSGSALESAVDLSDGDIETQAMAAGRLLKVKISANIDCIVTVVSLEKHKLENRLVSKTIREGRVLPAGESLEIEFNPAYADDWLEHLHVIASNQEFSSKEFVHEEIDLEFSEYITGVFRGLEVIDVKRKVADCVIPYRVGKPESSGE